MTIGFIGAGKVGTTLGKYFKEKGQRLSGFYSLTSESAKWAANFTDSKAYENMQDIIQESDMLMFTVPDGRIHQVWEEAKPLISHKILCHCSGLHSSDIFSDRDSTKSTGYSIHPLCAISDREHSWREMGQVLFTLEGDKSNIQKLQGMLRDLGNPVQCISASDKAKYHAAASLASNHMTAVFAMAQQLFIQCGFSEQHSQKELYRLARGNLENIQKQGCVNALTGPIERNDIDTVKKHLEVLPKDIQRAYKENAKRLVRIAGQRHPKRDYSEMNQLLYNSCDEICV